VTVSTSRPPSRRAVFCLLAAFALGAAIQCQDGEYSPAAIALVAAAIVLCVKAVWDGPRPLTQRGALVAWALSIACVAAQFASAFFTPPSGQFPWDDDLRLSPAPHTAAAFYAGLTVAAVLLIGACMAAGRARRVVLILMLAVHLALACWLIRHSPDPRIDTFVVQREAESALAAGRNPYAMTFPDIYHTTRRGARVVYGEGLVKDGRVQAGYAYPPISLLAGAAADAALGDPRYALAISATLAGAIMLLLGNSRWGVLAAAMFLFTPRLFFVIGRAWTEPIVLLTLMAFVWLAARKSRLGALAFGLLLAVKQYLFLLIPPAFLLPRRKPKTFTAFVAAAALTAAVVLMPFFLWGPQAFWFSTVQVQLLGPYREDGLTFFTWMHQLTGRWPPGWLTLIPLLAAYGLVLWRRDRTLAGFLSGAGLVLLVFFSFNKHAFANYSMLMIGTLCASAALDAHESPEAWSLQ
jgi:hypothetical protein